MKPVVNLSSGGFKKGVWLTKDSMSACAVGTQSVLISGFCPKWEWTCQGDPAKQCSDAKNFKWSFQELPIFSRAFFICQKIIFVSYTTHGIIAMPYSVKR